MKKKILSLFALIITITSIMSFNALKTLHDFSTKTIDGKTFNLSQLKGKKILIVNTASECGFTPQYEELEKLYKKYKNSNFVIIGFPANNFGGQEPGSNSDIASFCKKNYGVSFQMMQKISVKGKDIDPLYKWLTNKEENGKESESVKWNFNKFLIDENGNYVTHLGSNVNPMSDKITNWIEGKK